MTCNIDRTGRRIRAISGVGLMIAALGWLALVPSVPWTVHVLQALLGLCGAFAIFEGLVGWCAVRAMGVRTPF